MSNEDVVATSGFLGLLQRNQDDNNRYQLVLIADNSSAGSARFIDGDLSNYQGYTDLATAYHCDSIGNIIGECTHGSDISEKLTHHGIIE